MFQLLNATEWCGIKGIAETHSHESHVCDSWETKFIQIIVAISKHTNLKRKEPQINRKFIKCFNFIHLTAKWYFPEPWKIEVQWMNKRNCCNVQ